ncbi:hypothetical protein [Methylobacterium nodulans]|uniref:Uncharacterized protein n=1 Tax=Methylobacterium nodulans (strain LMG 21967 / CNCM I-2342 / ORS 2060) TaxID=460265 RepID=B8INA2_METNO|nr:hypothetical protein [Methylobacterium nodulans]ACL56428.1 hypothetical protein Mnod_1431 [Methylobacterium nodulans ORS 2060]
MKWFIKGPELPPAPETWTADLWEEVFPQPNRFHTLILVQEIRKQRELRSGSRHPDARTRYTGAIGGPSGSRVEHIRASIEFDTADVPLGSDRVPADSLGIVFTSNFRATGQAWPILVVKIWTDEAGAREFGEIFHRAIGTGIAFVPLWLTGEPRAAPLEGQDFAVIQPLTHVSFQQRLSLAEEADQIDWPS